MLIPLFALSWWIEGRVVQRRAGECSRTAVTWAVGVANLLSYGAMIAYIQRTPFLPEIAPSITTRIILHEGFNSAQAVQPLVEAFWAVHRRFPADAGELGNVGEPHDPSGFVVGLEADGRIVVRFHTPHHRHLDGQQIRLTPTPPPGAPDGKRLEWRCRSPDLHPELLALLARVRAPCSPE